MYTTRKSTRKTTNNPEVNSKKKKEESPPKMLIFYEDEDWFCDSSAKEKKRYISVMKEMDPWMEPLPSDQQVMDLKCAPDLKARLLRRLLSLEAYDVYSPMYERIEQSIVREYLFLRDVAIANTDPAMQKYLIPPLLTIHLPSTQQTSNDVLVPLRQRILMSSFESTVKQTLLMKCNSMEQLPMDDPDYRKMSDFIELALSIPLTPSQNDWTKLRAATKSTRDKQLSALLTKVRSHLDKHIHGMKRAKDEIIMELESSLSTVKSRRRVLALLGPPGVGKTELARCLGEALQRPFQQISMGGATDSHFILGHNYTYVGAKPGIISQNFIQSKVTDPVLFFDEFDKQSATVAEAMLHALDPVQNHEFKDAYFSDIPMNLSDVFFVVSLNSLDRIDKKLVDRLTIIYVDGYTKEEKLTIARNYLLPSLFAESTSLNETNVIISDDVLKDIIRLVQKDEEHLLAKPEKDETYYHQLRNKHPEKSGVRILKAFLITLIRRIRYAMLVPDAALPSLKSIQFPITITRSMIDEIYSAHSPLSSLLAHEPPPEGIYC
jgi:MoxR-like ATPase